MELKKNLGSKCPKCGSIFTETQERCDSCNVETQPITYYTKIRAERFAFTGTLSLIIGIVALSITGSFETGALAFVASLVIILSAFHTGNYFFGIGGGFKDIFFTDNKPTDDELRFSWSKFFADLFVLIGICILCGIVVAISHLFK